MALARMRRHLLALSLVALPLAAQSQDALNSAIWWNPSESGWGLFISDQGNVLSPFWFTHDTDGEPTWFVAPSTKGADGIYRGNILRFTGVPFAQIAGQASDPEQVIGQATLQFNADATLDFDYTVGSHSGSKLLERFNFGGEDIVCTPSATASRATASNYSDLWWNPGQSGWGVHIAHVGDGLYPTWYTYDSDREAVFFLGVTERQADGSFTGPLLRSRDGTPFTQINGAPPASGSDTVGSVTIRFTDGENGTFSYTVGSVTQTRPITRFQFGSVANSCSVQPYDDGGNDGGGGQGDVCLPPVKLGDEKELRTIQVKDGVTTTTVDVYKVAQQATFQGQTALVEETFGPASTGTGLKAKTYYAPESGDELAVFGSQGFDPSNGQLITTTVNDPLRISRPRSFSIGEEHVVNFQGRSTDHRFGFSSVEQIRDRAKLIARETVTTPAGTFQNACRFEIEHEVQISVAGITTVTRATGTNWTSPIWGEVKEQTTTTTVITGPISSTTSLTQTVELLSAKTGGQVIP